MTLKTMTFAALAAISLTGCATTGTTTGTTSASAAATQQDENFEADRAAILAMAGNYKVTFDFIESVSFDADYEIKDRKLSGGNEIVRVIADEGDFISLQHILVVGGDEKFPVKHWRQDWYYEPSSVLVFKGGNVWEKRPVSAAKAQGKWSQIVYQVDDAPRYGALGKWTHKDEISEWTPPSEWRPLPRRDATTRDDYHAVDAVNRHTITHDGWVHEQDNTKLILTGGTPRALVREIAINTYRKFDDFDINVGDDYWAETADYWAEVRAEWTRIENENAEFGLTIQGEPEEFYMKVLNLAGEVNDGEKTTAEAAADAKAVIAEYLTTSPDALPARIAATPALEADETD
ncbi:hypothetical protein PUV54_03225 [Hyphococcus flavus]|uniref:Lipoprotein n=1 Tax=Hyphococcus flavus TaxID=1866326 RepID=A0AAF0CGI0_9PROT|nr:DUF6607 family protein [Hyphococcus flavus]WDI32203.1 hypothetical protein PUV54_03225 [Hyphococcus flavus]